VAQPLITGPNIADPTRGGAFGVLDWSDPARTVTGNVAAASSNSPGSVADPRLFSPLAPGQERRAIMGRYRVIDWRQPSPGVTGPGTNSVYGVADERALALACSPRAGVYGVLSWQQAAATITGTARVDNGAFAVADPRPGEPGWRPPKGVIVVIVSQWNCWHRPLTTLELAVLQSIPWKIGGHPLTLAGTSIARKRERIGNAVPVHAASAVARSVLKALLASALGCWHLSGGPGEEIWVRSDGRPEDEFPDLDPPTYEALPT
jgi:site-specific DNA-cytosine methylase